MQSHSERDRLLAQVHRDQHLREVCVERVDGVGEGEGEVEVAAPVAHGHAGEVAEPVQVALRRQSVDDEAGGGDEAGQDEDAEAHFGLADAVVLLRQVGCQPVGRRREGDGEEVADGAADGDEARVGCAPVVGWGDDLDREGVVEGQGAEADVDPVRGDDPEDGRDEVVCECAVHGGEEFGVSVDSAPRFQRGDKRPAGRQVN